MSGTRKRSDGKTERVSTVRKHSQHRASHTKKLWNSLYHVIHWDDNSVSEPSRYPEVARCGVRRFSRITRKEFEMKSIALNKSGLAFARHWYQLLALAALLSFVAPDPGWSKTISYQRTTVETSSKGWVSTGDLNVPRWGHTATLLPNGKVLVVGGNTRIGNNTSITKSAELYDPASGSWRSTGDLNVARVGHTATLLAGGRLLVAGGTTSYEQPFVDTNTAELYDLETETWSLTGNLNDATSGHTATLLENGKVLVAGGWNGSSTLDKAEIYDPANGTWTITGSLVAARYWQTATLLKNGRVLVTGGSDDGDLANAFASSELYDPETGKWSLTGNLSVTRVLHTATLLPSGEVLVAGGYYWPPVSLAVSELYDPATGAWSPTTKSNAAREGHTATLLQNGEIIITGGYDWNSRSSPNTVEQYSRETEEWVITSKLASVRERHTATLLQSGKVLVAGGDKVTDSYDNIPLNSAELYEPSGIGSILSPTIISASVAGKKLIIVGENFDFGAVVVLNDEEQRTINDELKPSESLIAKKAGRKIKSGDRVRVRNSNGKVSEELVFSEL